MSTGEAQVLVPETTPAQPDSKNSIDRIVTGVEWIADTIALTALIVLMVITVANAALRYIINAPIPGSLSISLLYLMPAIVFLALPRVQAEGAHISATLIVDRLGPAHQRLCRLAVLCVVAVILTILLVASLEEVAHSWNAILPGQPVLFLGPSWILVPIGLVGAIFRALWQIGTGKYKESVDPVIEGLVDPDDSIYHRHEGDRETADEVVSDSRTDEKEQGIQHD